MPAALLLIDLQRWFLEVGPPEKLARVPDLLRHANALLDLFHDLDLPVIRVRTVHQADGSTWNRWMRETNTPRLLAGSREAAEHPELRLRPSDVVIDKTRHSAFIRTDLERVLLTRGVDTVLLAGFSTNLCVGLTAIEAYERDFRVVLAGEAMLGTNAEAERAMLDYLQVHFGLVPVVNADLAAMLTPLRPVPDSGGWPCSQPRR